MIKSTTKKITIILAICMLVAIILLYGFFWMIRSNMTKTVDYQNKIEEQLVAEATAKEFKASIEEIGPEIQRLTARIVEAEGYVEFIEMIESEARRLGISIEVVSATEGKHPSPEQFGVLKLDLRTQGSWKETYTFLGLIETLPYKLTLNSFTINSQPDFRTTSTTPVTSGSVWYGTYSLDVVRFK